MNNEEVPRMRNQAKQTNPVEGKVVWAPVKSLWFTAHLLIAVIGGGLTFSFEVAALAACFTVFTLCLGHSIGLHRLLIHRSFQCPLWFERFLVHLGIIVGMGGPFRVLYLHDIRDWSQRHPKCHPLFIHKKPFWLDLFWQIHCVVQLAHPPKFEIEPRVREDRFYQFMERTWMLQSLPWAVLFYAVGGWAYVIWGTSVRVVASLLGHSVVGYLAHNWGERDWLIDGHAVQGYNVAPLGMLAMGEGWHNNHHAFPGSARLGLTATQPDPGWWALCALEKLGLVWNLKEPNDFPERLELTRRESEWRAELRQFDSPT